MILANYSNSSKKPVLISNRTRREAAIRGEKQRRQGMMGSGGGSQVGGKLLTILITKDDLKKSPHEILKSNNISSNKNALIWKGVNLIVDEKLNIPLDNQGVSVGDTVYIVTDDEPAIQNDAKEDAKEDAATSNETNKAYFLFTASFKGMLKEFIDNLTNVLKSTTHIQIENDVQDGYNIAYAPRFIKRLSNVLGFYTVIYDIPDDELLKTLMQTNMYKALELITPVSPFIPIEGTNEFVFLSCPNWSTSIFHAEQYLGKFLNPETINIEKYVGEDKNLHTAFIKELNSNLSLKKETPIPIVSSREEPVINNFEDFLKK